MNASHSSKSFFFLEGVYFSSTKPNRRTVILSSNTERLPISPKRKQSSKPWITVLHSTDLPALVRKSRIYTLELVKSCSWCGLLEKQLSFIAPTAVDTQDMWETAALLVSVAWMLSTCSDASWAPRDICHGVRHLCTHAETETSPKWQHFLNYSFNCKQWFCSFH